MKTDRKIYKEKLKKFKKGLRQINHLIKAIRKEIKKGIIDKNQHDYLNARILEQYKLAEELDIELE